MKLTFRTTLAAAFVSTILGGATAGCSVEVPDPSGAKKPAKGGGEKGQGASASGQKGGSTATANTGSAQDQGAEAEGLACDASIDGLGWCADESTVLFCSANTWWLLSCPAIEPEAFCGYDVDLNVVDCFVIDEDGEPE